MLDDSPLTKSGDGAINDDGASPEQEESEKQEAQNREKQEEQPASQQSAPNTPSGFNAPSAQHNQLQQLTPHPVPIQPYYAPYLYPQYPGMPLFPGQAMVAATANYVDTSHMPDPPPDTRPRNRGGVAEPFPLKLHNMLETCEREGLGDVVSFFSHGRAFAIHKPRKFQDTVMTRFFKQTRLTSFQRQLNLYGFHRISQGPDHGGYYHEFFLRGRPRLSLNMKRTKIKGENRVSKRDYEGEPNFYAMPPILIPAASGAPGAEQSNAPATPQPTPPPAATMPSPAQAGMPFAVAPFGFAPPGPVFARQPDRGPYTAAQSSPSPAPGVHQQQQPQLQQPTMVPFPQQFYGGYPPWAGMSPQVAFGGDPSPARTSAPPTPAASTATGEDASSPSKSVGEPSAM